MNTWSVDSNAGTPLMMEGATADPRTMVKKPRTGFGGFMDALGAPQPVQQPGQEPMQPGQRLRGAIGQAIGAPTMGGMGGQIARFFL